MEQSEEDFVYEDYSGERGSDEEDEGSEAGLERTESEGRESEEEDVMEKSIREPEEGEEFRPEAKAYQRASKAGGQFTEAIGAQKYMQTRTTLELALEDTKSILDDLEKNPQVASKIEERLSTLKNLQFYQPFLIVLALLYDHYYGSRFTRNTFENFIAEKDLRGIAREDILRYIRIVKAL